MKFLSTIFSFWTRNEDKPAAPAHHQRHEVLTHAAPKPYTPASKPARPQDKSTPARQTQSDDGGDIIPLVVAAHILTTPSPAAADSHDSSPAPSTTDSFSGGGGSFGGGGSSGSFDSGSSSCGGGDCGFAPEFR